MNTIYKILALACAAAGFQSCEKDLQDEINDGKWNHERQVIDIKFENQIGVAEIEAVDATTGLIELSINVNAVPDLSNIKITNLQLSYQANSSVGIGDVLNFENKPWCWKENEGPACEIDNVLTFTMTGVSDNGNTNGICINEAGADGKYADFTYIGNNPENPGQAVNLDHFYRQIPIGESKWERDYAENTITFTDKDGNVTVGRLENAGTEDLGYDKSFTITDNAFTFTLNGTDDWTNIYQDYDKFVKKPRKYWISVKKI